MKRLTAILLTTLTFLYLNGCVKPNDNDIKKPENNKIIYFINTRYDSSFTDIENKWKRKYPGTSIDITRYGSGVNVTFAPRNLYYFEEREVYMREVFRLLIEKGESMQDIENEVVEGNPGPLSKTLLN